MAMIKWILTDSTKFATIEEKDTNSLYFLQDTQEIYKGEVSFTQPTVLVSAFPPKGALGKLYVKEDTLEGKVWNGSTWKTIVQAVAQSMTGNGSETAPVSGNAVKNYVAGKITEGLNGAVTNITYDGTEKAIKFTKGTGGAQSVPLTGFFTGASYEGETGKLSFTVQGGQKVDINLPKENFVKSGSYDPETKELVLVLQDDSEVRIPAGDLIDNTEFQSTQTVELAVDPEHGTVTANVKVSSEGGNALVKKSDGLFVQTPNIGNKLDKVATAKQGEIIIAKADGMVETSGFKAGGAALAGSPNDKTLATEAAVNAIKTALEATIGGKVAKSDISTTIGASGSSSDAKVASEKAVAKAIEAVKSETVAKSSITNAITGKATDKVVSEKAVSDALSWVEMLTPQPLP